MPPRSSQGESKQGLIITLVFFILATLGLGVSTYFGFAEQDKLDKAAKEAKRNEDTFKAERDYYKAQAMMFRGYMGMTDGMDGADTLGTLKTQLDGGSLGKTVKDNADVVKTMKTLESKYGWEGNQPKETLEETIKKLNTEYDNLAKLKATTDKNLADKTKALQEREKELADARKEFEDSLKKLTATFKQDFTKSDEQIAQLRSDMDRLSQQREKDKTDAEQKEKGLMAERDGLKKNIRDLNERVKDREERIASFEEKHPQAPPNMRTDWKIVYVDPRGTSPYINLGSADRVKPQLTFTIHGLGADGRPSPQSKGTLEVVNVIGPHTSLARITSVKDRNRDPIVVNDVVYNPSWNPNIKKHIAIAGTIDLTGDGRDSLQEFIRSLERQNIVVDAYVKPDGTPWGRITYQTDYLILGGAPSPDAQLGEAEKRVLEGRKQMQEEAKKYGVQQKSLLSYLEMIGYPLPHSARGPAASPYNEGRSDIVPRLDKNRFPPPPPSGDKTPPPANGDKTPPMPPDK